MPSRARDPQEPFGCFDPDAPPPRTTASGPSNLARKPFAPSRLEPISPTEAFRKRSTTLRLPAIDPETLGKRSTTARLPAIDPESFRKRSTTLRLPALDPASFHTHATLPRISAARQDELPEEAPLQPPSAVADLWLIAGPTRPGARGLLEQPRQLSPRLRVQLTLLVLGGTAAGWNDSVGLTWFMLRSPFKLAARWHDPRKKWVSANIFQGSACTSCSSRHQREQKGHNEEWKRWAAEVGTGLAAWFPGKKEEMTMEQPLPPRPNPPWPDPVPPPPEPEPPPDPVPEPQPPPSVLQSTRGVRRHGRAT